MDDFRGKENGIDRVDKLRATASTMVATACALEKNVCALGLDYQALERENTALQEKLRAAEARAHAAALTPGDLAAVLLQAFKCSGDLNLLVSTVMGAIHTKAGVVAFLGAQEKPLLLVQHLGPPYLAATIASTAADAMGSTLEAKAIGRAEEQAGAATKTDVEDEVKAKPEESPEIDMDTATVAAEDTTTEVKKTVDTAKIEPEAEDTEEEDGHAAVRVKRKRQRAEDSEDSSVRTWFRGAGLRSRKSSCPSKKSL